MKKLFGIFYILSCTAILVFVSTFIPSLYTIQRGHTKEVIQIIQKQYQEVATTLGLNEDFFANLVSEKDIHTGVKGTSIQKKAKLRLNEGKQESMYVLDENMIENTSAIMKEQYNQATFRFDTEEMLGQVRIYALLVGSGGSMILLVLAFMYKKRELNT